MGTASTCKDQDPVILGAIMDPKNLRKIECRFCHRMPVFTGCCADCVKILLIGILTGAVLILLDLALGGTMVGAILRALGVW